MKLRRSKVLQCHIVCQRNCVKKMFGKLNINPWSLSTEDQAVYAELSPGDAFMMLSSCYHGGSANKTDDEERLVYSCFMTKGYLRQVSRLVISQCDEMQTEG